MSDDAPQPAAIDPTPPRGRRHVLYPNAYVWFVFLAALDIMCTYMIMHPGLFHHPVAAEAVAVNAEIAVDPDPRGQELNPLAADIIERYGVPGKVAYKFGLVMLVILICEVVGRARFATGQRLAEWAVALTAVPVVVAIAQMMAGTFR